MYSRHFIFICFILKALLVDTTLLNFAQNTNWLQYIGILLLLGYLGMGGLLLNLTTF